MMDFWEVSYFVLGTCAQKCSIVKLSETIEDFEWGAFDRTEYL
jgi:hypothetical protein